MKRPFNWFQGFMLLLVGAVAGVAIALRWVAPQYLIHAIQRASKGRVLIDQADFAWPFTAKLMGVRALHNSLDAAVSAQSVSVTPRWGSLESRSLWIERLEIDRPLLKVTRDARGTLILPKVPGEAVSKAGGLGSAPWRVQVATLVVSNGIFEYVDQQSRAPFHGILDHISLIVGPVTLEAKAGGGIALIPVEQVGTSFALRGRFVGHHGAAAPAYCSGWLDAAMNDLQASCRLEPLPLTALEPFLSRGAAPLRVNTATLRSNSQWWSRANQFTGRLHLEINNLSDGDFSYRGRTTVDVRPRPGDDEPRLTGEVTLSGALDDPAAWQAQFSPGDDRVQGVLDRLLERGVKNLRLSLGQQGMWLLQLAPSTVEARTEMDAASREVQEALEILAGPPELPVITPPAEMAPVQSPGPELPVPNGKVPPTPLPASPPQPQAGP